MTIATLTSKGQITIPKAVREGLRLHTGDKIEFILSDGAEARLRPVTRKVDEVFGRLHQAGRKGVSVEVMDEGIKKVVRQGRT
jgi:AbrB family looped-hinge helix DNA binding protein